MTTQLFSHNEKCAIVYLLTMIMEADTIIHPKEIEYMDSILVSLAITTGDNDYMDSVDMQMCIDIIGGMSEDKRRKAKEMFVAMAKADGYLDPREEMLIERI